MKKIIALSLGMVLALQTSVVFADTAVNPVMTSTSVSAPAMEPAMTSLLAFNKWLYGNNFAGVSYINDNLSQAVTQALQWDPKATLSFVDISYQDPNQPHCSFNFGSLTQPNTVFQTECVDLKTTAMKGEATAASSPSTADNLFSEPTMKLRKFVSDILASTDIMTKIRTTMNGTSEDNVEFTLSKQNGQLMWKWGISDGHQKGMNVHADASQLNSPLGTDIL